MCFPATASFRLNDLAAVLAEDGYAGALCLEWERMWHPALPPIEAAFDSPRALPVVDRGARCARSPIDPERGRHHRQDKSS